MLLGYRAVWHSLRLIHHIIVPRRKVASILRELNPDAVLQRRSRRLTRRKSGAQPGFFVGRGEGRGVRVTSESANFFWGGGLGACSPEKILENLECLRLHFARFHSGESEEENIESLKEEVNHHRLIF